MANRESAKRAERRRRAKTTGVITLMLQAPRAGVVVALVRGGYLKAGVVPTDKELYEAAQRHYTDSLKDGVQVPRILAEQPPLGVKIESKAGKTAAQYDKHKASLLQDLHPGRERGFRSEPPRSSARPSHSTCRGGKSSQEGDKV